ncbi:MAG: tRNA-dihydrouridine synthase family protein [Phycisphaerales bacterium]
MSCHGNNATPPSPAIAPGAEGIDPRRAAEQAAARGMDPRLTALVPAFDAPFFQAGLSGYSDAAMRIIARRHGCPLCVTEALLDRTLLAGGRGFAKADLGEIEDNIPGGEEDHPLVGQIMGSDPREMAAAAVKMVEQAARAEREYRKLAYADGRLPATHLRLPGGEQLAPAPAPATATERRGPGSSTSCLRPSVPPSLPPRTFATIDVNLACPVKKIDRKARGGHWLSEPEGAVEILEAVREAVPAHIPCTVKLRRAYDDTPEMAAAFERLLDAAFRIGYGWATVHARTVEQKYIGPSRWDLLRGIVRRHPDKVILGSGDVWSSAELFRMLAYTGVSAVAVARGCIGNPWLFREAREMMAGRTPRPPTIGEQRAVLEEHFRLALAVNANGRSGVSQLRRAEAFTGMAMRKFGIRFAEHHPRAEEARRRFIGVSSLEGWRAVLEEYYAEPALAGQPA